MMLGSERTAMLRLIGAIYRRFRNAQHPHLCAFVLAFDQAPPERPLRVEWLA